MSYAVSTFRAVALAAASLMAGQAHAIASFVDVNLAGYQAVDDFGASGNSELFLNVTPGATVTGFSYSGLIFTTSGDSYGADLVLSVNNDDGSEFFDWAPSVTAASGTFGPAAGFWGGATGAEGPYGAGGTFVSDSGTLYVTTYLAYIDIDVGITVNAGTLRIFLDTPSTVPEPSSYALMGLGLLAVAGVARRRSA